MPRRATPEARRTATPPIFELRREEDFGADCPVRCILVPHDSAVEVVVNTAHGWASYDHAAHHAQEPNLAPMACLTDRPCGYAGTDPPPD